MKTLLIVNQQAGKGKTKRRWPELQRQLERFGIRYDVHLTSRPKEATEVARQAAAQYARVIAVGGDGTVNEVVNGLAGQPAAFGVLPSGTGNDFARMLQIPNNPYLAVQRLAVANERPADLLQLNGTYIAGAIGIGFDGAVAEDIDRAPWKKHAGSFAYVLGVLKLLFQFPPFTLRLQIDDRELLFPKCWLAAIGNSKFYAGGMKICPDAQHDDGLLDICVVHNLTQFELLKLLPSVFSGRHVLHPNIVCLQGKSVRVRTDRPVPMHGDGEIFGKTPGDITIHPHALRVLQ
ncbi:diacylglycerol/lipid kinase family protein [Effusibacillus pohliae]|uniref:diacylglycerol/lipid kinase family protein n=1 Tax=Effusibacillus pohliae TaxID=232270 RepID=UPI00036A39C2|nr:diacylglycerol kinase family protein [Effusibacillus pohliae]